MHAHIKSTFWADRHIENMPPEQKLALVWLMTNAGRDDCGFTAITPRRFTFDTGLPVGVLEEACAATCGSILVLPGNVYFVRAFIRHQFCQGDSLSLRNNSLRGLVRQVRRMPVARQAVFFAEYPELDEGCGELRPKDEPREDGAREVSAAAPRQDDGPASTMDDVVLAADAARKPDAVSIAALYPRRQSVREAVEHVSRHIRNGVDPQVIADGTRAIAEIIRQLPGGHLNAYVPSAGKFFANRRWEDDPRTWLRLVPAKGHPTPRNGAPPEKLSLGGRTGRTIRI